MSRTNGDVRDHGGGVLARIALLAFAAVLSFGSAAASPGSEAAMRCFIELDESGSTALLLGRVVASEAGAGSYRLVVTVAGPSGSSNLNQGGAFTARPGEETETGRVGFNIDGGRRFEAVLTATLAGRTVTCRRTGP